MMCEGFRRVCLALIVTNSSTIWRASSESNSTAGTSMPSASPVWLSECSASNRCWPSSTRSTPCSSGICSNPRSWCPATGVNVKRFSEVMLTAPGSAGLAGLGLRVAVHVVRDVAEDLEFHQAIDVLGREASLVELDSELFHAARRHSDHRRDTVTDRQTPVNRGVFAWTDLCFERA